MPEFLVGTSSWTDKTLIESGWYPPEAKTAEQRLQHYASNFRLVEVDATYYGLPAERNAVLWSERTPPDFTFNVKAFSMMTRHPTKIAALPKAMRERAPGSKATVYPNDVDAGLVDEIFEMFRSALMPLHSAGKLGFVLFQFPEWFLPGEESEAYILRCVARLPDYRLAIEFRRTTWMERRADRTLGFLREHDLPYVCVDMPQGFDSSIPPVLAATAKDLAVMRFHGHNNENWRKRGISVSERFDYLYRSDELRAWQPKLFELAEQAGRTHVLFNNCYRDNGVRNAAQMATLLRGQD